MIDNNSADVIADEYELNRVLILEEGGDPNVCAFFLDVEMDRFRVEFGPDPLCGFRVNPDGNAYLQLSQGHLNKIIMLAGEAEEAWQALRQFWDGDAWTGWQHLIDPPFVEGTSDDS